ncbi:GNAT family N-acetyltransferase [Actinoalloteichus fjordicus]|uniref:Acetyltransferase, ribosomal protein N-acetylase n=1 Tax=Actinoalloteichus fjordicus TaxID=1612552 RepID=A0AAC9LCZ8_9PSEU|nr:GNAT family protein [Actinoalloteichus fjordicus]APU15583.1 acetyltransferase, ribosomal protein N-acetylase [Actinoalloteichus fjordicus]
MWIRGDGAGLGPFSGDLVDQYWQWEQDPAVLVGYGRQTPDSLDNRREGYQHQARGTDDQLRFTVYDMSGAEPAPVGTTAVLIDHHVRTGEFVIQLSAASRGRGIGTEATRLTLDYAFHITNLRCVYLAVLSPNTAAIRAYEKAGFRTIGERRQSGYWLGEPANETLMDAIPADFPGTSAVRHIVEPAL